MSSISSKRARQSASSMYSVNMTFLSRQTLAQLVRILTHCDARRRRRYRFTGNGPRGMMARGDRRQASARSRTPLAAAARKAAP